MSIILHYSVLTNYYICIIFFFFNDTATTEIYTLSLHDALPISEVLAKLPPDWDIILWGWNFDSVLHVGDRKSTRLNSSHPSISYAVFCLKKKNEINCNILIN